MGTECPKFVLCIEKVRKWLVLHHVEVQQYLCEKNLDWAPSRDWWVFTYTMNALAHETNLGFEELQGMQTLFCNSDYL
jgi:hypothetical protein